MGKSAATNTTGQSESSNKMICPKCGGSHVHRSRRRNLEKWVSWRRRKSGQKTFRCYDCQHRFWDHKNPVRPIPMSLPSPVTLPDENKSGKQRRVRQNSQNGITTYHRFQEWLSRRHNLSVGILVILVILLVLSLSFVVVLMDQMG